MRLVSDIKMNMMLEALHKQTSHNQFMLFEMFMMKINSKGHLFVTCLTLTVDKSDLNHIPIYLVKY